MGGAAAPAAYVFIRDDRSLARERPVFVGLQARGALGEALTYWLELAHVRGRDGPRSIREWGVDVGVTCFKYYGELLDPELSNLAVATLGLGLRPTEWSSIDLVAYHYRQATASTAPVASPRSSRL